MTILLLLQLFYRGTDNNVWSRWRIPTIRSAEQHMVGSSKVIRSLPWTRHQCPTAFLPGHRQQRVVPLAIPTGSWSAEQHIGGVLNGDPIAAVVHRYQCPPALLPGPRPQLLVPLA